METKTLELESAIQILARTPAALDAWLRDLPDDWVRVNEGPDTFSAFDVVGHLIHAERTDWIPRLARTLEHGETVPFDPFDRFAQFLASEGKTFDAMLDEFALQRERSLAYLRTLNLTDEKLLVRGLHPELGSVTVAQLLATWVVHDLGHIAQIARVMSKRYSDEVGPWKAYLPVLTRK
jgi:uncharacterized damage-inducible protein DinB